MGFFCALAMHDVLKTLTCWCANVGKELLTMEITDLCTWESNYYN